MHAHQVHASHGQPSHIKILYMLVKALPRVCMKNTARQECRVVNTA